MKTKPIPCEQCRVGNPRPPCCECIAAGNVGNMLKALAAQQCDEVYQLADRLRAYAQDAHNAQLKVEGQEITVGQIVGGGTPYSMLPGDQMGFHAQVEIDLGPGLRLIIEDCDSDEHATKALAVARLVRNLLLGATCQ